MQVELYLLSGEAVVFWAAYGDTVLDLKKMVKRSRGYAKGMLLFYLGDFHLPDLAI